MFNKRGVAQLTQHLLRTHGLTDRGWRFVHATPRGLDGYVLHETKTLAVSETLHKLNNARVVRDTVVHEIAHALVGKSSDPPGQKWLAKAKRLGMKYHK